MHANTNTSDIFKYSLKTLKRIQCKLVRINSLTNRKSYVLPKVSKSYLFVGTSHNLIMHFRYFSSSGILLPVPAFVYCNCKINKIN